MINSKHSLFSSSSKRETEGWESQWMRSAQHVRTYKGRCKSIKACKLVNSVNCMHAGLVFCVYRNCGKSSRDARSCCAYRAWFLFSVNIPLSAWRRLKDKTMQCRGERAAYISLPWMTSRMLRGALPYILWCFILFCLYRNQKLTDKVFNKASAMRE